MFSITTICVYDFCAAVLVKKNTPCQGMIWIFPFKMLYFYTGFLMVLHKLTCEPWNAMAKTKMSRALPSSSCRGLCALDPANQCSKKTTSLLLALFLLYILPLKCTLSTCLSVNSLLCIHINTHFEMFWNNVTCLLVVLFFVCVRKHGWPSKVPTNILTRMGK